MIKRVGEGIVNGDIIEFNKNSEPLFLYYSGDLIKLTPQEQRIVFSARPEERFQKLFDFRVMNKY